MLLIYIISPLFIITYDIILGEIRKNKKYYRITNMC